ncbi:peroxisomal biogenesis factor 19 [Agrilus planipennis]|uniref:Peroxin-19 n=1 Tax=Agrilus planipennis TaxID=224129 RepID=A0A1W4WHV8_AGRPL|nr:peroxisomal biogenesis factor 19 [Agrilus planipennis]
MSEEAKDVNKKATEEDDKELSELLDSALQDFSKAPSSNSKTELENKSEAVTVEDGNIEVSEDAEWSDEFIKQAAAQFESNIAKLLETNGVQVTPEGLQQSFQRMAEAAAQIATNPSQAAPAPNSSLSTTISQTLQDLSQGTENLRNPFSEQDLLNMFGGQSGDENAFLPFMQDMMQTLLSKEVLYPSLKDLMEKYPLWLSANGGSLPTEQVEKYEKQQEVMKEVCNELEKEKETDTDEQKKQRFEKVLTLMQKLQDYGQPPKELIENVQVDCLPPFNEQMAKDQCTQM